MKFDDLPVGASCKFSSSSDRWLKTGYRTAVHDHDPSRRVNGTETTNWWEWEIFEPHYAEDHHVEVYRATTRAQLKAALARLSTVRLSSRLSMYDRTDVDRSIEALNQALECLDKSTIAAKINTLAKPL